MDNNLEIILASHPLTEGNKNFIWDNANEIKNFLPDGMISVSSFIHYCGLPTSGAPQVQHQTENLHLSLSTDEVKLADLAAKRNPLMKELKITISEIEETQAYMGRISNDLHNKNWLMESCEQHQARMHVIQLIQDFLNSM